MCVHVMLVTVVASNFFGAGCGDIIIIKKL